MQQATGLQGDGLCRRDGGGVATHWYVTLGLWGFDFSASSLVNSTGSSLQLSDCCEVRFLTAVPVDALCGRMLSEGVGPVGAPFQTTALFLALPGAGDQHEVDCRNNS
ncbi:hypothetical protein R6Z07F_005538 [Ovis aries]